MTLTFVHTRGTAVPFAHSSYNGFMFAYLLRLMQEKTDG